MYDIDELIAQNKLKIASAMVCSHKNGKAKLIFNFSAPLEWVDEKYRPKAKGSTLTLCGEADNFGKFYYSPIDEIFESRLWLDYKTLKDLQDSIEEDDCANFPLSKDNLMELVCYGLVYIARVEEKGNPLELKLGGWNTTYYGF